jgi:hypothetical protein
MREGSRKELEETKQSSADHREGEDSMRILLAHSRPISVYEENLDQEAGFLADFFHRV